MSDSAIHLIAAFVAALLVAPTALRAQAESSARSPRDRPTAPPARRRSVEALLDSFRGEPTVREVQRAALKHAGLDAGRAKTWAGRSRLANLVPDLQGEVGWLDETDRQLEYSEEFEFGKSGGSRDVADHQFAEDEQLRTAYSLEAELELGGLIFDRDEIYAARELRKQQSARQELIATVSDIYYRRRKKQVLRLVTPERKWKKRLEIVIAIERLTARLDGLTGGWFRRRLRSGS